MIQEEGLVVTEQDFERLSLLVNHFESETAELLEEELSRAKVVPQSEISRDIVTMNSQVCFLDQETGKESEVTLVYPKDADVTQRKISILAPIGMALIGLRVGQSIDWPVPKGGSRKLKVTSISYQPEAAGDWEL